MTEKNSNPRITLKLGEKVNINYDTYSYEIPFTVCTISENGTPERDVEFILEDENVSILHTHENQTNERGQVYGTIMIPTENNYGRAITITARRRDLPNEQTSQTPVRLPLLSFANLKERVKKRWSNTERKKQIAYHAGYRSGICLMIVFATMYFGYSMKLFMIALFAVLIFINSSNHPLLAICGLIIAVVGIINPSMLDGAIINASFIAMIIIPVSFAYEELVAKKQKVETDGDIIDEHITNPHPKIIAIASLILITFYCLCFIKVIFTQYSWEASNPPIDIESLSDDNIDVFAEIMEYKKFKFISPSEEIYKVIKNIVSTIWKTSLTVLNLPTILMPPVSAMGGCIKGIIQYILLFFIIIILETPKELMSFWHGNQVVKQGVGGSGKIEGKTFLQTLEPIALAKEMFDVLRSIWKWVIRW